MDGCELKILAMMKRCGEVVNLTSDTSSIRTILSGRRQMFRHAQNYDMISRTGRLLATHQGDVFILIGHEEKSPIVQDHTVHMLQRTARKQTPCFFCFSKQHCVFCLKVINSESFINTRWLTTGRMAPLALPQHTLLVWNDYKSTGLPV